MRLILLVFLTLAACSSLPPVNPGGVEGISQREYNALLEKNTAKSNQYSGFYQTFQVDATMLTTEMITAMLKQRAQFMQWDQATYNTEREKSLQEASAYTKIFLRFFSPDRDYDDLSKGAKSIWKVYLELNGSRFEGKVRKLNDKMVELQTLYPHFDRFSTPYEITFSVPMTTVESTKSKFVMTSSLGTAEFVFPTNK